MNTETSKFDEAENVGRVLFKSFLDQIGASGQPTVDKYDRVDYYFTLKDKKVVAEIKVRNDYYSEYLIEESKLEALKKKKMDNNQDVALYVCFYQDSMYIFTLGTIQQYGQKKTMWLKGTTVEDSGYRWKDVRLVPTDQASRYDLKEGRWVKYEKD